MPEFSLSPGEARIMRTHREKMPEERFQAILKEFEIDPKVFDPKLKEIFEKIREKV
jgi:hypothetical protein